MVVQWPFPGITGDHMATGGGWELWWECVLQGVANARPFLAVTVGGPYNPCHVSSKNPRACDINFRVLGQREIRIPVAGLSALDSLTNYTVSPDILSADGLIIGELLQETLAKKGQ
ncbi:hypothetical protein GOP47_0007868 [Adiantum capillus-veneris]|uniref:Uncharacterized protein n=1 Tax=Adiantum capillus-veneris TaxID=13818 RepID=A0A9D4V1M8_ADICA|nr:hypothetical protein GOP47_0007868 [Adiantum capillus-veneris]